MLPHSIASRILVIGVSGLALAGWLGVRVGVEAGMPLAAIPSEPAAAVPAAIEQVGDETLAVTTTTTSPAGLATGGVQPGVRDRSAWQPSPVPSQSKLTAAPSEPAAQPQTQTQAPAAATAQVPASSVRNRAAWQPSPIPTKPATAGTTSLTTRVTTAAVPAPIGIAPAGNTSDTIPAPAAVGLADSTSGSGAGSATGGASGPNLAEPAGTTQTASASADAGTAETEDAPSASASIPVTAGSAASSLPSLAPVPPAGGAVAGLPGIGSAAGAVAPGAPAIVAPPMAIPGGNPAPAPAAASNTTAASPPAATAGVAGAAAASGATGSAAPAAVPFTPLSSMFTTDKLEARFNGELPAKRGEWVEQHLYSPALGREDAYLVWLPPDYDQTSRRYPSLYLLHGVGGPSGYGVEEWLGYALTEDLDRMITLGMIEPMIVVLPNGEQGYWMNHSLDTDGTRWADFVAHDLVKDVDAHFRTDPQRERRGIGGLSMGGHGALQIALNHPDEFSVVGAHSPTIRPFETSPEFFGDEQWFAKYDPISLAQKTDAASKLAIWIDVGNADEEWLPAAEQLDQVLAAKKAPVQFHVLEGEHEGWYWEYYLPEYLNFYSSALNATAKTPKGAPVVDNRSILASTVVVSQANA